MERRPIEPSKTALLVVDMTNDFVEPGSEKLCEGAKDLLPKLGELISQCRSSRIPVIYTSHRYRADGQDLGVMADIFPGSLDATGRPTSLVEGTRGVEIVDALTPEPGDLVLHKSRYSAFAGTKLDAILREQGVTTLIVGGVVTNLCGESTVRDATCRDYRVVFLADGSASIDIPDTGWGGIDHVAAHRMALAILAYGFCEVSSVDDVIGRVRERDGSVLVR